MNIIRIPIGDWSHDGHGMTKDFYILSNYEVTELRQAYKDSCKLMGVQFNHNKNFTGLKEHDDYGTSRHICTDYQDNGLSDIVIEIFKQFNCPFEKEILDEGFVDGPELFFKLLLWFIGKSLPEDFKWEELKFETLNGYWNGDLNVQFGYGLFE